jgi:hypothetical protein
MRASSAGSGRRCWRSGIDILAAAAYDIGGCSSPVAIVIGGNGMRGWSAMPIIILSEERI